MNLPDDLKFIDIFIKPFQLTPNWAGIFRIILWTILFLITSNFIAPVIPPQLPHAKEMAKVGLTPILTARSDKRYARPDLQNLPEHSLLWIAGSSITISSDTQDDYIYLPAEIQPYLPKETQQYISLKIAGRFLDTYVMTIDALRRKPDSMVIILNPFWVMDDKSAFVKSNIMSFGAKTWANTVDWKLIPLLSSPGDLLRSSIGSKHKLINNSYDYLKFAANNLGIRKANVNKNTQPHKKHAQDIKENKVEKISYTTPLLFWLTQRYYPDADLSGFNAKNWHAKAMAQNNIKESIWAQKILRQMLQKIIDSGIPTLIYIAPTNPELENTVARTAYKSILRQVHNIATEYDGKNIRFIEQVPENVVQTMKFKDFLHLTDSGDFPEFLGNEISFMIENEKAGKK